MFIVFTMFIVFSTTFFTIFIVFSTIFFIVFTTNTINTIITTFIVER